MASSDRARRQADFVRLRIGELYENPIEGDFDAAHLKAVHACIVQDLPEHHPGVVRVDSDGWNKARKLERPGPSHVVRYAHEDVAGRIDNILDQFGGPDAIRGLAPAEAACAALWRSRPCAWIPRGQQPHASRIHTRASLEAGFTLD